MIKAKHLQPLVGKIIGVGIQYIGTDDKLALSSAEIADCETRLGRTGAPR